MCCPKTNTPTVAGLACPFCGDRVSGTWDAMLRDWSPSYWAADPDGAWREVDTPVCAACTAEYLRVGDDGTLELRPDVEPPGAWRTAPNH